MPARKEYGLFSGAGLEDSRLGFVMRREFPAKLSSDRSARIENVGFPNALLNALLTVALTMLRRFVRVQVATTPDPGLKAGMLYSARR